jgi:hypothetical protein
MGVPLMAYAVEDSCPDCAKEGTLNSIRNTLDQKPTGVTRTENNLYIKGEQTISGAYDTFSQRISHNNIFTAVTGYLTFELDSGSCPSWQVYAWVFYVRFDQFCGDLMTSLFPVIRGLIYFAASFVAFRWAFL